MENRLAQQVIKLISDASGDFIAKAMLNRTCERMGIKADALEPNRIPELADIIERSITLFADAATGAEVARKVRALAGR